MLPNTINSDEEPAVVPLEEIERHAENVIYQHLTHPQPNCSTFTVDKDAGLFEGERRFKFRLIPEETGFPRSLLYQFINIAGGMVVKDVEDNAVTILNDLYFIFRQDENPTLPPDTYSSSLIFEAIKRKVFGLPFPNPAEHLVSASQYKPYDLLKILKREVKWSTLKKKKVEHLVTAQQMAHVNFEAICATTKESFLEASSKHAENRSSLSAPAAAADISQNSSTPTTPLPKSPSKNEVPVTNGKEQVPEEWNTDLVTFEVDLLNYLKREHNYAPIPPCETSKSSPTCAIVKYSFGKIFKVTTDPTAESELSASKNASPIPDHDHEPVTPDKSKEHCGLQSDVELIDLCEEVSSGSVTPPRAIRNDLKTPDTSSLMRSPWKLDFSLGRSPSNLSQVESQRAADADGSKARDDDTSSSDPVPTRSVIEVEKTIPELITSSPHSKEYSNSELKGAAAVGSSNSESMKSKSTHLDESIDGETSKLEVMVVDEDGDDVKIIKDEMGKTRPKVMKYYTDEEDKLIIKNICEVEAFMNTGSMRLYDAMSKSKDFNGKRSGASLFARWMRHIKPRLLDEHRRYNFARKWNISPDNLKKILKGLQKSKPKSIWNANLAHFHID